MSLLRDAVPETPLTLSLSPTPDPIESAQSTVKAASLGMFETLQTEGKTARSQLDSDTTNEPASSIKVQYPQPMLPSLSNLDQALQMSQMLPIWRMFLRQVPSARLTWRYLFVSAQTCNSHACNTQEGGKVLHRRTTVALRLHLSDAIACIYMHHPIQWLSALIIVCACAFSCAF